MQYGIVMITSVYIVIFVYICPFFYFVNVDKLETILVVTRYWLDSRNFYLFFFFFLSYSFLLYQT